MKNVSQFLCTLFLCTLLFSCQKEKNTVIEPEMLSKTKAWLTSIQALSLGQETNDKMSYLLKKMQTNSMVDERVNSQEYLTVFSLEGEYETLSKETKAHKNFLLVVSDNNRKILFAKIGRFVPTAGTADIPAQAFLDFYNKQNPGYDGKYSFLSLTGSYLYDFTFEKGNKTSFGLATKKDKLTDAVYTPLSTGGCIDWYLITTYYWPDGSTTVIEQYMYTTCAIHPEIPEDPGGGGGGGYSEVEAVRTESWHAFYGEVYGTWATVWASDRLKGRRNSSEPQGGHFTGISFQGLSCNNSSIIYDYTEKAQNYSGQTATSRVQAIVKKEGQPWLGDDRTKTNNFSEIFP